MVEGLEHLAGGTGVAPCGIGVAVTQNILDDVDTAAALMQMGSGGVAQTMDGVGAGDPGALACLVEGEGEGCFLDARVRGAGVEQPSDRSRTDVAPVAAQVLEHPAGQ